MAFCKYCGKELEEGALCSCPGAIHEQQAKNNPDITPAADDDTTENTGTSALNDNINLIKPSAAETPASEGPAIRKANYTAKKQDDGSFLKFSVIVAAVLIVFIIIACCLFGSSGFKGTVRKYFTSRYSKHGGKTYYSLTLPDDGIAELKDNDLWQELVEDYNDDVENRMDEWDKKPKFRKISKVKDMKNSELKDAEKYFLSAAEVCDADVEADDIKIKKGYAVTYKYKNTEGDNEKTTVYVVKIKGEGWKIMNGQGTSFYGLDN